MAATPISTNIALKYKVYVWLTRNCTGCVMVSVIFLSAIDHASSLLITQLQEYEQRLVAQIQDNMPERSKMSDPHLIQ